MRARHGREFKLEAVRLVRERRYAAAAISACLLRNWVKAFEADPQFAFLGKGQMKSERLEIERLRREVQRLKAERDILHEAASIV